VTAHLTAEIRGEATHDIVAAGGALDWLIDDFGVLSATAALSEGKDVGTGWFAGAGFSHQSPDASATLRARWSSSDWRQVGVTEFSPVPWVELAASASARLGRFGTFNVAYVDQRYRERGDNEFATVGWSVPLTQGAVLGIAGLHNFTERSTTVSIAITMALGERDTASVGWYRQRDRDRDERSGQVNIQRALPLGEGFGYRVYARSERDVQAAVAWQGSFGTYAAEASRFEGSDAARLSISGGIGALGGHVFASREITESFGVVRVADYDDVRILLENQPAARTSSGGYAVLPRLRAYDLNQIGIAQESLPLDASIGRLKVDAVPSYRSGVLIDFPVKRSRGATVTILMVDGMTMPAGAVAEIEGSDGVFPVGEGGLAYLSGLAASNRITVRLRGERCTFELPYPATDDPLPDLGRVVCRPHD
jgi:outer membrane usher protein